MFPPTEFGGLAQRLRAEAQFQIAGLAAAAERLTCSAQLQLAVRNCKTVLKRRLQCRGLRARVWGQVVNDQCVAAPWPCAAALAVAVGRRQN